MKILRIIMSLCLCLPTVVFSGEIKINTDTRFVCDNLIEDSVTKKLTPVEGTKLFGCNQHFKTSKCDVEFVTKDKMLIWYWEIDQSKDQTRPTSTSVRFDEVDRDQSDNYVIKSWISKTDLNRRENTETNRINTCFQVGGEPLTWGCDPNSWLCK